MLLGFSGVTEALGKVIHYPHSFFVMVLEFFFIHMHLAIESGKIKPLKRSEQFQISHLLFADDMLVFCRADKSSIKGLNGIIKNLHLNTGLKVNRGKM